MKETELYEPVKKFLMESIGCTHVYAEVLNYDIVAKIGKQIVIVELKTALTFKVIEQAIEAKRHGNYVFVAVPKSNNAHKRIIHDFLKFHGVGLIIVDKSTHAYFGENLHTQIPTGMFAKYNRKTSDITKYIQEGYHDQIKGGYKMGDKDFNYQSDYTLMIENVKFYLQRHSKEWKSVSEILEYCQCYYSNSKPQLAATLKAHWNQDWVEHCIINRKSHFRYKSD